MIMSVAMTAIVVTGVVDTPVTVARIATLCLCFTRGYKRNAENPCRTHMNVSVIRAERAVLWHINTNIPPHGFLSVIFW